MAKSKLGQKLHTIEELGAYETNTLIDMNGVINIVNNVFDNNLHGGFIEAKGHRQEFIEAIIEHYSSAYKSPYDTKKYDAAREASVININSMIALQNKKLVPSKLQTKYEISYKENIINKKIDVNLKDILRSVYYVNEKARTYRHMYRVIDGCFDRPEFNPVVISFSYNVFDAKLEIVNKSNDKIRILVRPEYSSDKIKPYFNYMREWRSYDNDLRQFVTTRGEGTTSSVQIFDKLEKYSKYLVYKSEKEEKQKITGELILSKIKDTFGTTEISHRNGQTRDLSRCSFDGRFDFYVGDNRNVLYLWDNGKITVYSLSPDILSSMDPLEAMILYR